MMALYAVALLFLPGVVSVMVLWSWLAKKKGGVVWEPWAMVLGIASLILSSPLFLMGVTNLFLIVVGGGIDFTPWFKETWFWTGWLFSLIWVPVLVLVLSCRGIQWDRPTWRAIYLGGVLSVLSVTTLANMIGMLIVTLAVYVFSNPVEVAEVLSPSGNVRYSIEMNRFDGDQYVLYAQQADSDVFRKELGHAYLPSRDTTNPEMRWSKDHQLLIVCFSDGDPILTANVVTGEVKDYQRTGSIDDYVKLLHEHQGFVGADEQQENQGK